jgi:replicative DNA helicase
VTEEFERTPPHDIAAEQSALGGVLLSKEALYDVAEIIQSRDFYRPAHQLVLEAALGLDARGEPVDSITVAHELTVAGNIGKVGGAPYLHTLIASVPTAANAGYYARIVLERARLRRLIEAGTRIVQLGYSGDGDVDDIVDRANAEMVTATAGLEKSGLRTASQIYWDVLKAIEEGKPPGLTTGIRDLDDVLTLGAGQLIVVAARTSVGKSVFGLNLGAHIAIDLGLPVYYWSGEMSQDELMTRLISAEAGVSYKALLDRQLDEAQLRRVLARSDAIENAPIEIDDTENVPQSHVRAALRRMQRAGTLPAAAIIDYLTLHRMPAAESRQYAVADLITGYKTTAREFGIPVVVLHQLNRNSEHRTDHVPVLSDLAHSGQIEADADKVILLHREDMYDRESPRAGEIDLIIAKHRNGPLMTVTAAFQGHLARIVDMAPDYYRQAA